ncbi:MAG: serine phosphatase [Candidatus Aminicenantes bacterium]|nr:serine phosphatase [Candidatus Aminicenantes bacterium]
MAAPADFILRQQLLDRRLRLEQAVSVTGESHQVRNLIHEVDAALARMETGSYGLCEVCHEPIETERLITDPLTRLCLDHLTPNQQRALEIDLELAAAIQKGLLPDPHLHSGLWEAAYHYKPAGIVSGDYCDLIRAERAGFYFILGDVAGKGVAASMLMVHLQAMFRTLIPMGLSLRELVERASRVFCESTLPTHYATLVCGRASVSGEVEVCNAGHPPPLLIGRGKVLSIDPTGLPLGAFCDLTFATSRFCVEPGQTILLYTDGLSEARDRSGQMYGAERLREFVNEQQTSFPQDLIKTCLKDLAAFQKDVPAGDDLTIMAIGRSAAS